VVYTLIDPTKIERRKKTRQGKYDELAQTLLRNLGKAAPLPFETRDEMLSLRAKVTSNLKHGIPNPGLYRVRTRTGDHSLYVWLEKAK
jgi:hypothetical protein